jgi:hypothetical protein
MSNVGKWDRWYSLMSEEDGPQPYGDSDTYKLGAEHLAGCSVIEDWGCGKGWLRTLVEPERYRGIDGSHSPFADEVADLTTYHSDVAGIFIRHVLEHDYRWREILSNAIESFRERMALIIFTPMHQSDEFPAAWHDHEIAWNEDPGVPDLSLPTDYIENAFATAGAVVAHTTIDSPQTQYGVETIFLATKP